ncbi:ribulokinase [Staphylococcus warneri]|uniref:ribulokinase n=1 Tax=Staphylococcus warneri TaxID=1292 RepID=UPI00073623D9|nr:ribulokinase [Staphylococcus warneri]AXZ22723.1 ribulokinase [Staphylococcus warneri]KTW05383.1 ribulokinase [Staphylococcus warneri]OIS47165.1 ribulokinase [Staphylococcus warneri]OIS47839.1 ribulokinase [Staphylococcus warneri]PTI08731.1 ribulokinase [Staphylococcus warneri]
MSYSIGIDYGTASGRVILVNTSDGKIVSSYEETYQHGTIAEELGGETLPHNYFLQHAGDYHHVLENGVKHVLEESQINKDEVVGIGVDFTSCTVVFLDENFRPLHMNEDLSHHPHAYVKLWKHHGAQDEATQMVEANEKANQNWLDYYGHSVNSEWMIPKILEVKHKAPELLERAHYIMEAGDYMTSLLVNQNIRSNCGIGFKGFYDEVNGFNYDFFETVDPELPQIIKDKCEAPVIQIGDSAGSLSEYYQNLWGLSSNVQISPYMIDAHSGVLGAGAIEKGEFTPVIGTSTCHLMLDPKQEPIPSITGSVKDAIIPGLYAYEAGQAAVGDLFSYSERMAPQHIVEEAAKQDKSVLEYLETLASQIPVEDQHVVVLDWHNGNRSILSDSHLTGSVFGLTLQTPFEMVHRAYLESTAFGTKMIMKQFEDNDIPVHTVYASGGIPKKSQLLVDIYANVLNKKVVVLESSNATALGAAMLGANVGGAYDTLRETVQHMKQPVYYEKQPDPEKVKHYEKLFDKYQKLHDLLGREHPELSYIHETE